MSAEKQDGAGSTAPTAGAGTGNFVKLVVRDTGFRQRAFDMATLSSTVRELVQVTH